MARGWRYAKLYLACVMRIASVLLNVFPARLCILPNIISGICFLSFVLFSFSLIFVIFASFFCLMLLLELCRYSSHQFLSKRPRTRLTSSCITGCD